MAARHITMFGTTDFVCMGLTVQRQNMQQRSSGYVITAM
jgi:hypothetical protein